MTEKSPLSIWMGIADVPLRLHYVDAAGVRTRVLEAGSGSPLVLLHGTSGHLEAYARNIKGLADHFHVIAYDMIGHGYSARPDYPYTTAVYSDHLIGLLDALNIERAHISGESLGGWVSAWTAAHHPERVDHLVLNTPGNITSKPAVMQRVKESSLQAARDPSFDNVRRRVEVLFYEKNRPLITDELVLLRQAIYQQDSFAHTMENIVALQEPALREQYAWSESWCSHITAPTFLLWTDHDPTGTLAEADLLHSWIRNSKLYVMQDAGHWPQWEKPEEFNRLHHEFLIEEAI
jgi:2-hydroxy-6-oxonona-2,4-dienedioate hydrolase